MTMRDVEAASVWLRRPNPAPAAAGRLICFPHAGGSATFYWPVARALGQRFDVIAVQYPGRQDRRTEPCAETIAELAEEITRHLWPLVDLPLTFFGHSMGAIVGFEVARRLEARGIVLAGLFASGRRAPDIDRDERVHLRDDAGLLAEVRSLAGPSAALLDDEEVVRMVLPAIRADYRAIETYRCLPGPPLRCPIIALTGDADPKVGVAEALAWAGHTTGRFGSQVFSGGHFYLNDHLSKVIDTIAEHMASTGVPRR